ncbi:conserved membrane hypothetical protein [Frankia canadensis]|uniref:Uncharacterized protein n=1 Tax=Frankia canadensis TaxID=1836972 RepID=A0A2I2KJX0_9ACTN|nr:hypothetical protein [Frankia canadensis]SNQ45969.1 conserved membrane hypothetical protein [Frankia canadensis]SOU53259.1 conserved membrane hypothetical protein [Frankia canadensis]
MPDSSALDVLIGLALLFAAFSLAVSRINEAVLGLLHYRGRRLESELRRLLGGPNAGAGGQDGERPDDVTSELFDGPLRVMRAAGEGRSSAAMADHPPVRGGWAAVRRARRLSLPSYVPSTAFAQALVDRVDPPARAMLSQLRPDGLPAQVSDEARATYQAAYEAATRALDETTARALHAAMPAEHAAGRVIAAALVSAVGAGAVDTLEQGLAGLPPSPAKSALTAAVVRTGGDREKIVAELAQWYDQAMDRLSGWYKRRVAIFLLCYAVVLSAAFNLDAIGISRALWQDGTVRAAAVSASGTELGRSEPASTPADDADASGGDPGDTTEAAIRAVRDASGLALPIGWVAADDQRDDPREAPSSVAGWLLKVLGLAIACFALTAGAPFWFELLGRLVNMRSSGPKPRSATVS